MHCSDRTSVEGQPVLILALAAAVLYGTADFLGGVAARRADPFAVIVLTVPAGALIMLTVIAAVAVTRGGALVRFGSWDDAGWAAAGGVVGAIGLVAFYSGFASAPMSVVAPVSALVSTVLPVGVAMADGERPGASVIVGAVICLAAIVLVSAESRGEPGAKPNADAGKSRPARKLRGFCYGVAAGAAFGLFFVFVKNAGQDAVLWPVAVQRLAGTVVAFAIFSISRGAIIRPGRAGIDKQLLRVALASGVLDVMANVCYVLATRLGMFGLTVVITSLYPGATVLLARFVLLERMRRLQQVGLVLAAAGVILVSV
jgi:drug/metabolite transporter (DMT)-like permease